MSASEGTGVIYLNTFHVLIYLKNQGLHGKESRDLNTSHVLIYRKL